MSDYAKVYQYKHCDDVYYAWQIGSDSRNPRFIPEELDLQCKPLLHDRINFVSDSCAVVSSDVVETVPSFGMSWTAKKGDWLVTAGNRIIVIADDIFRQLFTQTDTYKAESLNTSYRRGRW